MSNFGGRMKEYNCVSIDRFDGQNLESTVYFLSHAHTDHMVGLSSENLHYRLQNNKLKLYCSKITQQLLLTDEKYRHLQPHLEPLSVNEPHIIAIPDPSSFKALTEVTVTLLQAGHCPGSVMFLFEGDEGTALYTGDFRLSRTEVQDMDQLHSGANPKVLDSLYVDTTFCIPEAFYIPSRLEGTEAVIKLVRDWITQGPNHIVVIHHKAKLGYENLFMELASTFSTKIHMKARRHDVYSKVPHITGFSTTDPIGQIHACVGQFGCGIGKRAKLPCGRVLPPGEVFDLRVITVSTLYFTQQVAITDSTIMKVPERRYRVCYSFHSSYAEIRDIIMYLNPRRVVPNVIPMNNTFNQIQERVNRFLAMASARQPPLTDSQHRPLGKIRKRKKKEIKNNTPTDDSENLIFDTDNDLTPQKKRQRRSTTDSIPGKSPEFKLNLSQSSGEQESPAIVSSGNVQSGDGDSDYVDSTRGSDMELFPDDDNEDGTVKVQCSDLVDEELVETQRSFEPVLNGLYGPSLAYYSDTEDENEDDLSDMDTDLCKREEMKIDAAPEILGNIEKISDNVDEKKISECVVTSKDSSSEVVPIDVINSTTGKEDSLDQNPVKKVGSEEENDMQCHKKAGINSVDILSTKLPTGHVAELKDVSSDTGKDISEKSDEIKEDEMESEQSSFSQSLLGIPDSESKEVGNAIEDISDAENNGENDISTGKNVESDEKEQKNQTEAKQAEKPSDCADEDKALSEVESIDGGRNENLEGKNAGEIMDDVEVISDEEDEIEVTHMSPRSLDPVMLSPTRPHCANMTSTTFTHSQTYHQTSCQQDMRSFHQTTCRHTGISKPSCAYHSHRGWPHPGSPRLGSARPIVHAVTSTSCSIRFQHAAAGFVQHQSLNKAVTEGDVIDLTEPEEESSGHVESRDVGPDSETSTSDSEVESHISTHRDLSLRARRNKKLRKEIETVTIENKKMEHEEITNLDEENRIPRTVKVNDKTIKATARKRTARKSTRDVSRVTAGTSKPSTSKDVNADESPKTSDVEIEDDNEGLGYNADSECESSDIEELSADEGSDDEVDQRKKKKVPTATLR